MLKLGQMLVGYGKANPDLGNTHYFFEPVLDVVLAGASSIANETSDPKNQLSVDGLSLFSSETTCLTTWRRIQHGGKDEHMKKKRTVAHLQAKLTRRRKKTTVRKKVPAF